MVTFTQSTTQEAVLLTVGRHTHNLIRYNVHVPTIFFLNIIPSVSKIALSGWFHKEADSAADSFIGETQSYYVPLFARSIVCYLLWAKNLKKKFKKKEKEIDK